jgi:hypothetical protein
MDLIERYLGSVGTFLPSRQRADIVDELRDVLMSRREEREGRLGRKLSDGEEAEMLREFGHPLQVAGRYGPQRTLIGPELYPIFLVALKIVLAIVAVGALVNASVNYVFVGGGGQIGPAIGAGIAVLWEGWVTAFAVIVFVFAIFEWQGVKLLDHWDPRQLPRPQRRPRRGWVDNVAAIIVQVLALLWWTHVLKFWNPVIPLKEGGQITLHLAAVWTTLYWPVVGLSLGVILVHALKLAGRRAQALAFDVAVQVGLVVIAAIAMQADKWVMVTGPAAAVAGIDFGINLGLRITLIVVIVTGVATAAYDLWRLGRPDGGCGGPTSVGTPAARRR